MPETINTLRFGMRAGSVKVAPKKNYQTEGEEHYQYLKDMFTKERELREEA